jgi:hypothetical protein
VRVLLYEPIPITFGCFYQGMSKLFFCRAVPRRLRTSIRLLVTAAAISNVAAVASISPATAASSVVALASGHKRNVFRDPN